MRFQLLSCEAQTEQETDFETAVDLVHYTIVETQTVIKTPGGVRIEVRETEISAGTSHLEPDLSDDAVFDNETTRYFHVAGDEPPATRHEKAINVQEVLPLPLLEEADWAEYERLKPDLGWEGTQHGLSYDQARRLWQYQEHLDQFDRQANEAYARGQNLVLEDDFLVAMREAGTGDVFDATIPDALAERIGEWERAQQAQIERNAHARMANSISHGSWQAKQAIQVQVGLAKRQFAA